MSSFSAAHGVFASGALIGLLATVPAAAQSNPVLGKTVVCGTLRTTFAANGDVTFNRPVDGKRGGRLKVAQNPSFKDIKDLQVVDAQGKFILHIQQKSNGGYEMEGDRCTLAK